jgi:hypothetical protein
VIDRVENLESAREVNPRLFGLSMHEADASLKAAAPKKVLGSNAVASLPLTGGGAEGNAGADLPSTAIHESFSAQASGRVLPPHSTGSSRNSFTRMPSTGNGSTNGFTRMASAAFSRLASVASSIGGTGIREHADVWHAVVCMLPVASRVPAAQSC